MITYPGVFYKQKMPFSACKQMDKMCHLPYKKGIHSTLMAADAFILQIFNKST